MRSAAATPYIERAGCIQHPSVFVVKLRTPAAHPTTDNPHLALKWAKRRNGQHRRSRRHTV